MEKSPAAAHTMSHTENAYKMTNTLINKGRNILLQQHDSGDEVHVMHVGQIITQVLGYRLRPSKYAPYIYYKTDTQTGAGTAATGVKKNYMYRLPVSHVG